MAETQQTLAVQLREKADGYPASKASALMYIAAYALEQQLAQIRELEAELDASLKREQALRDFRRPPVPVNEETDG